MTNEEKILNDMAKQADENHEAAITDDDTDKVGVVFMLLIENLFDDADKEDDESPGMNTNHFKHIIPIYISEFDDATDICRYDWNVYGYNDEPGTVCVITEMLEYGGAIISTAGNVSHYTQSLCQEVSKIILNKIGYHENVSVTMISVLRFLLDLADKANDSTLLKNIETLINDPYTSPIMKRYLEYDFMNHIGVIREDGSFSETDKANIPRLTNIINQARERDEE